VKIGTLFTLVLGTVQTSTKQTDAQTGGQVTHCGLLVTLQNPRFLPLSQI